MVVRVIDRTDYAQRSVTQEIKKILNEERAVIVNGSKDLHGLAAGLHQGNVTIKGDVGDFAGSLNAGAYIVIEGNSGNYVADNMTNGILVVNGDAGYCAAPYC